MCTLTPKIFLRNTTERLRLQPPLDLESVYIRFSKKMRRLSTSLTVVLVLTLTGYPLVAGLSELLSAPNRMLSIAMRSLIVSAVILAFLHKLNSQRRLVKSFFFSAVFYLFWALYLIRLVVDYLFETGSLKLPISDYILFGIGTCFLPAAAMLSTHSKEFNSKIAINAIAFTATIALLLAFWNIFALENLLSASDLFSLRVETKTLNPISMGHLGSSLLIVCMWQIFSSARKQRQWVLQTTYLFGGFIGIAGIVFSASRGPVLSTLLAAFVLVCANPKLITKPSSIFLVIVSGFVIMHFSISGEVLALNRVIDSSFQDNPRNELLSAGLQIVLQNPLLGAGIEPLYTYPHNLLLESFMVYGAFSGILFSAMLIYSSATAWRILRNRSTHGWIALLFIQYAFGAMVSSSLYGASAFWVMMALVVACGATLHHRITGSIQTSLTSR